MKNKLKAISLLLLAIITLIGCKSSLEPGGAYAPATVTVITNADSSLSTNSVAITAADPAFFVVDSTFYLAYTLVNSAFDYERDTLRKATNLPLSLRLQIKHDLDGIRPTAVLVRNEYIIARNAYMANPTPAGLDFLSAALAKLQQLQSAATAAMSALPITAPHAAPPSP